MPDPDDPVVAPASPPGPAARALVRLSGPGVHRILGRCVGNGEFPFHRLTPAAWNYGGSRLPVELLLSPAGNSATGQESAEIHMIGCQPLVDAVVEQLVAGGCRTAGPGEFTMRAFLAGKIDLTRAEAVQAAVAAGSDDELKLALSHLAGGVSTPLDLIRDELLNLLADLEAGLDFVDEDIEFVGRSEVVLRVGSALARVANLRRQVEDRAGGGPSFRAVLVGEPNAGKSSLFNALAGLKVALVGAKAGTTRDYLSRSVELADAKVELVDTAGLRETPDAIEGQAQKLGRKTADRADLVLRCVSLEHVADSPEADARTIVVGTKFDRALDRIARTGEHPPDHVISTSAATGHGLAKLRAAIRERVEARRLPALASSLARCRSSLDKCSAHLREAHGFALGGGDNELIALELRLALEQLGEMTGAVHTEDLLGRVFSRFCVGK